MKKLIFIYWEFPNETNKVIYALGEFPIRHHSVIYAIGEFPIRHHSIIYALGEFPIRHDSKSIAIFLSTIKNISNKCLNCNLSNWNDFDEIIIYQILNTKKKPGLK